MSWGERSCKTQNPQCSKAFEKYHSCNVDCPAYQWDGKTKPDSLSLNELLYGQRAKRSLDRLAEGEK